jgi:hypothetical protein
MTQVEHFGVVRAEVDDQAHTITLSLSREPTGEVSIKKIRQWAIDVMSKKYPSFLIDDKTCNEQLS